MIYICCHFKFENKPMTLSNNIQHVFFDLDHTLWDFDKNSELAFEQIFKDNYPQIENQKFIAAYIPINQACWKLYQNDEINHNELRYKRLKDAFDAINYSISDEEIEAIAVDYLTLLPENNHLFEGAIAILDYLQSKYHLHIITNGFAEVQEKKLTNAKIKHYFKTITDSDNSGVKKPNPIIFDFAIAAANAKKENSIMIGDCLDADVLGAINFGIDAIWFSAVPTLTTLNIKQINHLSALKNYL
jgi:putative hydrolase of the HAD superfamily